MPDSVYKRLSFHAADYGLLFNLTNRIIPLIAIILAMVSVSVILAYSLNGRAVPRQFVVGMIITFVILAMLWAILSTIRCCRPKCAGKHNLRLEPPAAEPVPVPEIARPGGGDTGPANLGDRPKQEPAVMRQKLESKALGDLCDQIKHDIKEWANKYYPYLHYRDSVRARAPTHAPREMNAPAGHPARRNQHDRRREETAEGEGMLARWRRSYLDLSDSGMTNAEAEGLYRHQRDRDCRAARVDAQRAYQAYCANDDNRSQNSDNTEVGPPRVVPRQEYHHHNLPPRQKKRVLNEKDFLNLPPRAHNPRR